MSAVHVYVIAEAGVNHNGSLETARQLVDAAVAAGADAVKFQTFRATDVMVPDAPKADYQVSATGSDESQLQMVQHLALDESAHRELLAYCVSRGIEFLSSPFDAWSIDLLDRLGLATIKVPSGEITNLPYLRRIGALRRRLIVSTGMSTMDEVADALDALEASGTPLALVTLLHCTSEYPAPYDEINLRAMVALGREFGLPYGYSDHTLGNEVALSAIALGAVVVEKHLTLDRSMPGPDHAASAEPAQIADLIRAIRHIEAALGDGVKRPMPSELSTMRVARKSIVAARDIAEGERFAEENLTTKRPASGVSPMAWDRLLGRPASRGYRADERIDVGEVD
ncbi:MAG: N-acetylneuraminate synthase [Coriobacteriia bacterium]